MPFANQNTLQADWKLRTKMIVVFIVAGSCVHVKELKLHLICPWPYCVTQMLVLLDFGLTKRFTPEMKVAFSRLVHSSFENDIPTIAASVKITVKRRPLPRHVLLRGKWVPHHKLYIR